MPRIEIDMLDRYLIVEHLENGAELPVFVVQMIYEKSINFRGDENLKCFSMLTEDQSKEAYQLTCSTL